MKMNIKTIISDYNTETGLSTVTIATDIGQFTDYAQLHEDDKEIASTYAGCRFAETRAGIQYMKEKARIARYKLESLYKIYNDLKQRHGFNEKNIGIKLLEKEIYLLEDEKETFTKYAQTLSNKLNEDIETHPKIVREMIEKVKQDSE